MENIQRTGSSTSVPSNSSKAIDVEAVFSASEAQLSPTNIMDCESPVRPSSEFAKYGLREDIQRALGAINITQETDIQKKALPSLIEGESAVILSQTGTGKTHTYLLPLFEQLKRQEEEGFERRPHRPRALIIVPNRELAEQIQAFIKQLSHHCKLRSVMLTGGTKIKLQRVALESPVDIVVATPGRFMAHKEKGNVFMSELRHLVVDEIDSMFNGTFDEELEVIVKSGQKKENLQKVLAGATLSTSMSKVIDRYYPDLERIVTKSLHRTVRGLSETTVDVPANNDKQAALLDEMLINKCKRTIVFCNTIASCRSTEHILSEQGYRTVGFHGDIPPMTRASNFESFVRGKCDILVATDCASRGLDTMNVEHVINFDFPTNIEDYLHRVGRTARAGRRGMVTSFTTKQDRALSNAIKEANRFNLSLADLNASRDNNERVLARLRPDSARSRPRISLKPERETTSMNATKSTNSRQGRSSKVPKVRQSRRAGQGKGPRRTS